jgi:DNA-binding MarR family transcriptional regulator
MEKRPLMAEPEFALQGDFRTLLHRVVDLLDRRGLKPGAHVESIRPSDERLFLILAREPLTISRLARTAGISRQAAHASIGRLAARDLVRLDHAPGSRRDKVAMVTVQGEIARRDAETRRELIQREIQEMLGRARANELSSLLADLVNGLQKA